MSTIINTIINNILALCAYYIIVSLTDYFITSFHLLKYLAIHDKKTLFKYPLPCKVVWDQIWTWNIFQNFDFTVLEIKNSLLLLHPVKTKKSSARKTGVLPVFEPEPRSGFRSRFPFSEWSLGNLRAAKRLQGGFWHTSGAVFYTFGAVFK